jgi:phosphomannomutase
MSQHPLHRIVKSYDIRGLVDGELTPEVTRALGAAFVDVVVGVGAELVVGYDMRESSPLLAESFIEGALARGATVRNIGLCSTDMVYFASGTWNAPAVMFTASHNPATYNGLKFSRALAQGISLESGLGDIRDRALEYLAGTVSDSDSDSESVGTSHPEDVLVAYATHLRNLVSLKGSRPLRVVVDAANGMAGLTVPAVLGTAAGLAPLKLEIIPLYFELDGSFPNHEANPLEPTNLVDLQAAVVAHDADLGLAFDGDADRCFVIDEHGNAVTPSTVAALVAGREIDAARAHGDESPITVLHNLLCSTSVSDVITEKGAIPVRTRVGHSLIKDRMRETGAVFGGEHSAHYYFRNFWGADNGMLAALHVIAELGASDEPLSELVTPLSRYVESGELNTIVGDQGATIARVRAAFDHRAHLDELDGITFSGEQEGHFWWFNVRSSNTEPLLRLNVEAETSEVMVALRDEVLALIHQA